MKSSTLKSLMELPELFTIDTLTNALNGHPSGPLLAETLVEHGILVRVPIAHASITVLYDGEELLAWTSPAVSPANIYIIAGTERTMEAALLELGASQLPEGALVGTMIVRRRDMLLGPIRKLSEVRPFVRRTVCNEWVPHAVELELLEIWLPRGRGLMTEALQGVRWYTISTIGIVE